MVIKIFKDSEMEDMYPATGPCSTQDFAENFTVRNNEMYINFDGSSVKVTGAGTQWYFCSPKKNKFPRCVSK